jgi:hypothetical protein
MIAGGAPKAPRKSAKRAVQKEADKKQADLF